MWPRSVTSTSAASVNLQVACQGATSTLNTLPVANVFRPYPGLGEIFSLQNVAEIGDVYKRRLSESAGGVPGGNEYIEYASGGQRVSALSRSGRDFLAAKCGRDR